MRQESQGLSREKEILQLRKGETADDMEKHMKEIRKELEEVDADNRKLREQAFKTGGDMVSVRVTEDDFRVKQEENRALKHEIADLKAKVEHEKSRFPTGPVPPAAQVLATKLKQAPPPVIPKPAAKEEVQVVEAKGVRIDGDMTIEDVASAWGEISDLEGARVFDSALASVQAALGNK